MKTQFLSNRAVLLILGLFLAALTLLLLPACSAAPTAEAQAQIPAAYGVVRDEENGMLLYVSQNWGLAFPFTHTPGAAEPIPSATPAVIAPTSTANKSATPTPSQTALPSPTYTRAAPISEVPQPVLLNASFDEDGGWVKYYVQVSVPEKRPETFIVQNGDGAYAGQVIDGAYALKFQASYFCWRGGVYQRVPTAAGYWHRFSVAGFTWSQSTNDFLQATDVNTYQFFRVGIDPLGGVDPKNSRVEWSGNDANDNYQRLAVESISRAGFITVFAEFNLGYHYPDQCNWPIMNNWAYLDAAGLELLR